jgi:hypothetical protein
MYSSTHHRSARNTLLRAASRLLAVACLCLLTISASWGISRLDTLNTLTRERELLTSELEQYRKTLAMLHTDGTPPGTSTNPAVRTLAQEMIGIRTRLIRITEQEVTLLQEEILQSKSSITTSETPDTNSTVGDTPVIAPGAEGKPLRMSSDIPSSAQNIAREIDEVERLRQLLTAYYVEQQEALEVMPSPEELAQREAAASTAGTTDLIPFSVDKLHLNGAEGSTVLTQFTQRLSDPTIPESRRDMAPICTLKTRLFGSLIASEKRSLRPVGKHHYVARVRIQPGDTTLRIRDNNWQLRLPGDASAQDFLITLYAPPGAQAELHLVSVQELTATEDAHIPAWLPTELALSAKGE